MPANVNVNVNLIPNTKQVDVAFDSISKRASSVKFGQPLGRISGDVTEFRKSLEAATARVTAFGLTAGAIYKVSEAIRAGARATIEIDKQLVELNTFLGQSRDQLEGFSQSLFKVARNAAVPFEAASEAAKEFARQGLSANEVLRRTEDALTLARISGISYADAVNGVTTAINSFNKEALSSTDIINKLIAVDTRFAVSSAQLNEALTRVGSSAEESGISIDKLIATVTAAQQITGRGGAVIGNALKTIFTRLQRPEVLSQLEQLGVAIKDQNGFLLDGLSVLKNYADATKNLSQIEKSRTAELIGGIYQINQVNALIKDLSSSNSVYASALKISSAATDEAKKKNEELNKSLSALLQQTKNQAQEAAAALGKPFLEPIVKIGSSFSQTLLKFVNPTSDLLGKSEETGRSVGESFFKGTASVLGKTLATSAVPLLVGIGGTLLGKMISFGVKSVKDVGKSFDDMFVSEKSLASQKAVNDILSQSPKLVALVQKGTISLAAAEQAVLQTLKEQNRQLKTQEALRARIIPTVVAKGGPTRVRASGYVPTFGNAQEEVAMAKAYGAKNPKAKLIQATIKGKTQPVMVNSEEDIIPNFAGTGDTAIIPRYRKMQDIPRMSSGYVPNFSSVSGSFGRVSKINESQVRKTFFSGAGQSGAGEIANEFLASRKLSEQIQASRELGYQGMRGGYISKLFQAPDTYGTLAESIKSGSIVKSLAQGKTAKEIGDNLDKYTGEYKNYYELVTNLGRLSAKQITSGKAMEARDLANFGNLMLNKKAEDLITKIVARKGGERLVGKMNSSWQTTSRVAEALARQGARISLVDPGIFAGLDKKRKKELGKLGYEDNYREMTGVNAAGYIPNFAEKDKYKFPNISSAKMEANIARNFEKLSPGDQKYFARAYEDYNNLIKVFSKASGTSPEKFANVMSALSPANPLERNALDALRYNLFAKKKLSTIASPIFLDEREIGSVKAQTYGANRTKAANLIVGLEKLTGNKRKAFLNNMLDPFGSPDVTVDYRAQGDALNKKFNVKNAPTMNREQYDKVSQAFRNVGSRAGVSGLGVQAATWIGGRMGSKAARGQDFNRGILKFFYDNPDKISLENLEFLLNVPGKGKERANFFKKASAMGVSKLGSDSLISISRAGGYIPNFAGLSDAISREKTMSGLPASQIMAHFDKSGEPIAVTNKKDEPNGLKDVVPNFAKMQSMGNASKLFKKLFTGGSSVPNPITGSFQVAQNQFYTQFLDELAEREVINKNISTAAGYGLPIGLGGASIYKSLTTPGLGKGARAVGIATGIGQIAAGAGLAYTAGGDLDQRIQSRKFEDALDRSKKAFTDLSENTTELSASLAKLDAAYKDPKADPKEIVKLVKTREDLIKKITIKNPELVSRLAGQTSITDQITVLEENLKKAQTQEAIRTSALEFGRKGKITGQQAPAELSSFFNEIINRANADIFKTDLSQATTANFGEILKKAGLDVKEFSDQLNSDQLKKAFIEALKVAQGIEKISANQAKEIARISKPLASRRQAVEDARDIRSEIKKALEQQLPELAELAGTFSKRAGISASSEASLAIKKADAAVSFQNSLLTQLNDKEFLANLSPAVEARLRNIESPGAGAARELESLQKLPGLSEAQAKGIQKLIDFNSQQTRDIGKATIIADESKKIQLKFLALQEKIAFGGDIRTSINPQMRAEAMASSLRGPLTYQLGSMIGSRRGQVAGATDFLTDTLQKYPGLLTTKGGKEPSDIQAVKAELTRLNAFDMQRDLMRRAGMAQMMGLGQTAGLLRGKAFDQSYLLESAGLKTSALFGSPEIPKDIQKAMGDLEKFNVESVRQAKAEDATLRGLENIISPIKEKLIETSEAQSKALIAAFENGLKSAFGTTGINTTLVNINTKETKFSESNKAAEAAPAGVPSSANGLTKYSNSIADAVKREKTALASRGIMGVPNFAMADINLERSPDLVNASNPAGFAITNSIDEKNGLRSLGMRSSGFIPNFAKSSNIDPLLERIYGPKAGAAKTPKAVKTPPASIQGVSASTMPFYPEGAMERTYPRGPRLSISNVNPYGRVLTKAERAAAGELIPGASRNPFTGQFMSKKDIDLVQTIKAGKEAKAATLAQRKALIEIERATRPAGPNPIFAQTARESGLAQIGAAKYAERQGSLSKLASPIFDPALDPAKKMSAQELQNRLKITTERPASPNSINAQKQRLAEALKAETLKQAEQNRRQNLANRYFERTAPQRAEMKAFSEAQQARLAKEAADKIRSGQRIDLSNIIRGYGTTAFAKGRSADLRGVISKLNLDAYGASNFKQYTPEEVNKILASKKPTQPAATSGLLGSIAKSMPTSGIAGRAVRAGAFGLKGLGIAGAAGFGITQGLEAYVAAKEGEYKKATLAGLSSAASFASLVKGAGKVAGPAGVALAGLTDLDLKTLTLASDWKDIFGRKGEEESIGLGDIAGTGLAAITALPAVVGLLGYRTGNILENKLGLGTKLGDFGAGSMTARASYEAGIRPKGGMTVNEAVKANQLVAKKSELVGQINKLNQISGNPLISRDFQISASRRGQEAAAEKEVEDLKKKLDEESVAAKAAMAGRVSGKVKGEMARLDKESEARDEGQRSKLRKTFLESFEKDAEANGFLTTSDRVNYLLSQEGKNGLGSFKPTDFKDAEFARSFNAYKTARETQAAREANQVIPASTIEFRNRPIPSFPQDVLEEATRTGRSAEKVIADREEAALRRGAASQGMTTPEINTQMSREYTSATGLQDFPKDVLEEAVRRRVTAEQVMQERASGIVPNFAAMSNSMMASGDVYSRMRISAPRMSFPSAAQGSVPNFAIGEFSDAITEAMRNGITSAFPNGPSSSSVSNSNVINIDGRTSIQNAPDEAMQGIISILFDKIPELKKLGPAALNFKR